MTVRPVTDDIAQLTFELARCLRQKCLKASDGGMHLPQVHALLFIQSHPGITMKELAAMLRVTSPSATSFVDRLVKLGYVRRESDEHNRKLVRLNLTEAGAASLKQMISERQKMLVQVLSVLSETDQQALRSIMQKLITHCSR